MSHTNPIVEIKGLTKNYGDTTVLRGIDLTINRKDVIAIIGPSGTGKSTFLRCLNYLEVPTKGTISIDGISINAENYTRKEVHKLRTHSSMVFQAYNLFKNKTALENITEALLMTHKKSKAEANAIAEALLEKVGMLDKKDAYPSRLSGGQQQRIGIARALAVNPSILLLDEPTSSLDPELVIDILNIIKKLAEEGMTMVLVTHEINFAKQIANRIIFMDRGQIAMDGSPDEVLLNKDNARIQQFLNTTQH